MASIALAIAGLASAGIGAGASLSAAGTQASAAQNAQQLQSQEAANALAEQQREFNINQTNEAPFLQAGQGAVGTLSQLLAQPGSGLTTPFSQTFSPPTAAQAAATPGEQFELQQGEQAINNSAAAAGGLLSTGTAKNLDQYANNVASTNYQQTYNNALSQYQTAFNVFNSNQANEYNRYASLAGLGQTTAAQLGNQGQAAAANTANIDLTTGAQQGQQLNNAAAATASGYVGAANAANSGLGNLSQYLLLSQLLQGGATLGSNNANLQGLSDSIAAGGGTGGAT